MSYDLFAHLGLKKAEQSAQATLTQAIGVVLSTGASATLLTRWATGQTITREEVGLAGVALACTLCRSPLPSKSGLTDKDVKAADAQGAISAEQQAAVDQAHQMIDRKVQDGIQQYVAAQAARLPNPDKTLLADLGNAADGRLAAALAQANAAAPIAGVGALVIPVIEGQAESTGVETKGAL